MKLLRWSLAAAVIGLLPAGSPPVQAETAYPWCLRVVAEDYSVDRCEYKTLEACNRERINEGPASFCVVNPVTYFREQGGSKPGSAKRG